MSNHLEIVNRFFAAVGAKNIDAAVECFAANAVVESPMGPQRGKEQIKSGLKMMASMPAPAAPPQAALEDGKVVARLTTPMGAMKMIFEFEGDLIVKQSMKMGG
jgi:ketosteroid isomerase-like protein